MEQMALIIATWKWQDGPTLHFVVGIFALMVLSTFELHKLAMGSRIKVLEKHLNEVAEEKGKLELQFKLVLNELEYVYGAYHAKTIKSKSN